MKIAMFSIMPPVLSGIATHTHQIGKRLSEEGHEVHVISFLNEEGEKEVDGIKIHGFPSYYDLGDLYSMKTPLCVPKLEDTLKEIDPDILHTHHRTSLLEFFFDKIKDICPVPIVSTVHCSSGYVYPINLRNTIYHFHYKAMSKALEEYSDKVISISNYNKNKLLEEGVSDDKIEIIRNGVNIDKFDEVGRKDAREDLGIKENEKVITFAGRQSSEKGIHYLISGFKDLEGDNLKLRIVGDGPLKNIYKLLAKTDSRINLVGEKRGRELIKNYKASDIFVLPSSHPEPQGIVLYEAMAAKLPTVASNTGGIPEVVDDDTGILVEPKSAESITKALEELLENKKERKRLGNNGYEKVKNKNSWDKITGQTEEVYESLLN